MRRKSTNGMRHKRMARAAGREWEMISLIDVIFLLLVFALVVSRGKSTGEDEGVPYDALRLEFTTERLDGAMVQKIEMKGPSIGPETEPVRYMVTAGFFDATEEEFDALPASRTLKETIYTYIKRWQSDRDGNREAIRVRPSLETPFRIIDYIVRQCSGYGDSLLVFMNPLDGGGA